MRAIFRFGPKEWRARSSRGIAWELKVAGSRQRVFHTEVKGDVEEIFYRILGSIPFVPCSIRASSILYIPYSSRRAPGLLRNSASNSELFAFQCRSYWTLLSIENLPSPVTPAARYAFDIPLWIPQLSNEYALLKNGASWTRAESIAISGLQRTSEQAGARNKAHLLEVEICMECR